MHIFPANMHIFRVEICTNEKKVVSLHAFSANRN